MKKLVFLCIASCGLGLASCGGTSASESPDIVKDKVEEKDTLLVKEDVQDDVLDETETSLDTPEKIKEKKSDKKKR
jgi:hypothetical protein